MKSDRAEGSAIASVVLKCALSRPDVSLRFIKDGKIEYHTPGDSRVDSCIYSLLGRDIEAGFLSAESSDEAVAVKGFISSPAAARGNRSYQFFFVNGRVIRSLLLQSALEQAYKNTLPTGRFPSCVLFITTKASDVDVNVHPAKTEVKFVSDKQIFDGVYYATLGALDKLGYREQGIGNREQELGNREQGTGNREQGIRNREQGIGNSHQSGFKTMHVDEYRKSYVSEFINSYKTPEKDSSKFPSSIPTDQAPKASDSDTLCTSSPTPYSLFPTPLPPNSYSLTSDPPPRVIGEALNVYIIVEHQDSVWFIDKHAAHERIHFDALKSSEYKPMSESLLTPVICRLGHEDASLLLENVEFLEHLGFSVESFGDDAVAIRHIPADIDISDTESVLSELCPQLRHSGIAEPSKRDEIFKTIACKAAIKAGHASGRSELESLAKKVMSGEISHCPHGRPVVFELTKSTLDKGFGRI